MSERAGNVRVPVDIVQKDYYSGHLLVAADDMEGALAILREHGNGKWTRDGVQLIDYADDMSLMDYGETVRIYLRDRDDPDADPEKVLDLALRHTNPVTGALREAVEWMQAERDLLRQGVACGGDGEIPDDDDRAMIDEWDAKLAALRAVLTPEEV